MSRTFRCAALMLHEKVTGRRILKRLEDLNRTQWLSNDELREIQQIKLQSLLNYAYLHVPYYRRTFDQIGFRPADILQNPESFLRIPLLTKSIIRDNWNDLLTTEPARRHKMNRLSTSGSTGQPLIFMQDSDFRDSVTADIQRHLGWADCQLGDVHAMIWGAPQNPSISKKIRLALIDTIWNRFQINAFALTDKTLMSFAERVKRAKPKILFGYATSLYHFAQFIRKSSYTDISFQGVFSTSERLLPPVRAFIEETFQCKVFDRYGTLELGGVACECEAHTGLHVSMENNYVEILHDGLLANPGEIGDITVTNLNNLGMPFIRYSIGDAGAWYIGKKCPCGRSSAMIQRLEGRLVESFYTRDGRRVWSGFAGAGFRCLAQPAVKQFQIIQKSLDHMIVRLVVDNELSQPAKQEIISAFKSTYGENVRVDLEFPPQIPALPSGKHQYAISEINQLQRSGPALRGGQE